MYNPPVSRILRRNEIFIIHILPHPSGDSEGWKERARVAPFKDDFSGPVMDRRQDRLDEGAAAVVDTVLEGWMLLSHPRNGKECGKACTKLGISAGKMKVNDLGFSKYENGIDYQCQITVNYSSPFEFPVEVVPGESLLLTLSSFLVGNETRQDEKDPGRDNKTSFKDRQWLPLWTTTGDQNGEPLPPLAMAGVLAHSVALVVQRIGNGREQKTVKKKRSTVMAILGINWKRVGAVLGGIAGLQILVAVLAGRITIGTLEVNDDVDSVMEILNSQKFQTKEAEEQAWVTEQAAGQKELTYRFTGVVGRGDAPGKS
ncbi:hypothetical protein BDZ91DRAFT_461731 [Kalaharituber pfeilii]|nr:hypothetical protein BDZ91DRAFT_461731 [Kalaharituber pfeilii]